MTDNLPEQMHAPTGTTVAVAAPGDPNTTLDAGDVRLPRMKFGQYLSRVVTDELVPYGVIYKVDSPDDMEPQVFAAPADSKGKLGEPVRFYVLGVRKGFSYKDLNDDLKISPDGSYPHLSDVLNNNPKNVRRTYDYTIVVPQHYTDLPVQFLMHGQWGGQAAKQMNTRLLLAQKSGIDPATVAFKVQAKKAESDKGPFAQAIIGLDTITAAEKQDDQALIESFQDLLAGSTVTVAEDVAGDEDKSAVEAPSLA